MKVLCPQCERLISLEVFRVDGNTLIVSCTKCGAESHVESLPTALVPELAAQSNQAAQVGQVGQAAQAGASSRPPRVSLASTEGGSNVVVLRRAGDDAVQKAAKAADEGPFALPGGVCPKCIAPRSAAAACPQCGLIFETFDEATVTMPKWLREGWVALLRDWGNEAKHAQLRRRAQQIEALAAVGRLYRMRQVFVPEDPFAASGRAELLRLASGVIELRASPEDFAEKKKRVLLISIAAMITFILALVVLSQSGGR